MKLFRIRRRPPIKKRSGLAFLDLPEDILGEILVLVSVEDHIACLQTCKYLQDIGNRQWVWHRKFHADFDYTEETQSVDWKQIYAQQFQYWALRPPKSTILSYYTTISNLVYDTDFDGKSLIVYAYANGVIGYRRLDTSSNGTTLISPSTPLYSCLIDPDQNLVYCGTEQGICLVLCARSMKLLSSVKVLEHEDSVFRSLKCPFGIVFAGSCGAISLLQNNGNKNYNIILLKNAHSAAINGLAYSSKLGALVTSSCDGHVKVWRWSQTLARLICCRKYSLDFENGDLSSLAIHEDTFLAGGQPDGSIHRYSLLDGRHIGSLSGHRRTVRTMHSDGRYLVSGSYDSTVRLWDLKTGRLLQTIGEDVEKPQWVLSVCLKHRKVVYGAGSDCNLLEFR